MVMIAPYLVRTCSVFDLRCKFSKFQHNVKILCSLAVLFSPSLNLCVLRISVFNLDNSRIQYRNKSKSDTQVLFSLSQFFFFLCESLFSPYLRV